MSSEPTLHYGVQDGVATLRIDHPARHNAMTFQMWQRLPALAAQAQDDPAVRVLLLRGTGGKAFCSGSDISQFGERRSTPEGIALWNGTVVQAVDALARVAKPTVALIEGLCMGGGMGLALHCDLRFATEDASFAIPAAKLGVAYYPSWLRRLSALAGPAVAKELMFTARRYDARQALSIGLVNAADGVEAALERVARMAALAPLSQAASKMAIDEAVAPGTHGEQACQQALERCFASDDYKEGQAAFQAKRPPVFVGA
ncbi:enoyl-CoA hydratase [Orrella sp. JC864]|uniref:enoyl-CoA hydratase n=1 Tax=Orrella sp. JC864 TaxID=3120298 RepID=UPI003009D11B